MLAAKVIAAIFWFGTSTWFCVTSYQNKSFEFGLLETIKMLAQLALLAGMNYLLKCI